MIRNVITILIFLSLGLHSAISDKSWDRKDVEKAPRHRHKHIRQPAEETYAAIPVAIVYEDIRDDKSLKNNVKDEMIQTTSESEKDIDTTMTDRSIESSTMKDPDNIITNVSINMDNKVTTNDQQVTSQFESDNFSKSSVIDKGVNENVTDVNLLDNTGLTPNIDDSQKKTNLKTEYSSEEGYIPVAVIYDRDTNIIRTKKENISVPSSTTKAPIAPSPRRRIAQKQRKQQKDFVLRASSVDENMGETTTPSISEPQERHEVVQSENKTQNKEQTSVVPNMEQISVTPQNEKISRASQNAVVKSRMRIASTESTTKNGTKMEKKRRERIPVVPIIESENHIYSHTGEFRYSYEGGDGTKAFSEGELKSYDNDKTGEAVVGGFSYKDKEGNDFSISYTADENGYRPVGDHLPTPPPIPPAIARALLYLATKTTPEPVTESQKP